MFTITLIKCKCWLSSSSHELTCVEYIYIRYRLIPKNIEFATHTCIIYNINSSSNNHAVVVLSNSKTLFYFASFLWMAQLSECDSWSCVQCSAPGSRWHPNKHRKGERKKKYYRIHHIYKKKKTEIGQMAQWMNEWMNK